MATARNSISVFIVVLFHGVCNGAQWVGNSLPEGQQLYACADDTVTLTWEYLLSQGDSLGDIHWFYDGNSQEMVALSTQGMFVPMAPFSHRVSQVGNAGISLQKVVAGDAGNYSVEIHVYANSGSSHVVLRRTDFLHVMDHLMTADGSLHARQSPDAVYDSNTDHWALQLQCGVFLFPDYSPTLYVEWIAPSGQTYNSTSYSNGYFNLLIPRPMIATGSYICRIPQHLAASACLHGNAGHQGEATLTLDTLEARMSIMEKENEQLLMKLAQTGSSLSQLTQENQVLKNQTESTVNQLTQENQVLKNQMNQTESTVNQLNQENQVLKNQMQQAEVQLSQINAIHNSVTAGLSVRLDHAESTVNQLNQENQVLKNQMQQAEAQLSQVSAVHNAVTSALSGRLDHAESTVNQLNQENQVLRNQMNQTESTVNQLNQENQVLKPQMHQAEVQLSQINAVHNSVTSGLSFRLDNIEDAARERKVAFQAVGLLSSQQPAGKPIIFADVLLNQGQAYNFTSGYFNPPVTGVYCFMASTSGVDANNNPSEFQLYVGNHRITGSSNTFDAHLDFSKVHAVVHVNAGQKVWIRSDGSTFYIGDYSAFSGFLLYADSP